MTLFGNRLIAGVISYDEVILESSGSQIQKAWYSFNKGKHGHRDRHAQREDNVN